MLLTFNVKKNSDICSSMLNFYIFDGIRLRFSLVEYQYTAMIKLLAILNKAL